MGKKSKIPTRERFIELCEKYDTREEIGQEIGVSADTVSRYANKLDVKLSDFNIKRGTRPRVPNSPELTRKIVIAYFQEHSLNSVYSKFSVDIRRIGNSLRSVGIKIPKSGSMKIQEHFKGNHWIPIPPVLLELMDGELLGDSSIDRPRKRVSAKHITLPDYEYALRTPPHLVKSLLSNKIRLAEAVRQYNEALETFSVAQIANFSTNRSPLAEPWIIFLAQRFQQYGYTVVISPRDYSIRMRSKKSVQTYHQYYRWHSDGKKRVPIDIRITPRVLLYWFVGDGSTDTKCVKLSSHSFSEKQNEFLRRSVSRGRYSSIRSSN